MIVKYINVNLVINESKLNRFHISILLWGLIILLFDGFDLVVYGAVVPVLMKEWSLTAIEAGALGSYALFGMMLGATIFGPLADKIGRKKVILICVVLFSLFTALIGFAGNPGIFGLFRFLAGLGLGGVMPNVIALMTEYSPKNMRGMLVTTMCSGYAIGGVLSAALSIGLISNFGWQSVFFIGAIPLLILPFLYKYLPDSPSFYLRKNQNEEVGKILEKVNPDFTYESSHVYQLEVSKENKIPILELFHKKRALSTLMLWTNALMTLLVLYGLNTWLPKLMVNAGYPLGSSLTFLLTLNFGAIIGSVFGGWLSDRWHPKKVLVTYYMISCLALILLGFKPSMFLLYILLAFAGATTIGSQIVANVYVSQYYPMHIRSTGVGWSLGIGRLGAVLGPTLGGILLSFNLSLQVNFLVFAIPCILAALAIVLVQDKYGNLSVINRTNNENKIEDIAL
ncbi:AAHS family benzoate transporter-like MFS transporter [Neobacillus niacini]|uniref:MFS transporter n=1 Tax=Neobacillus niacini TaxID=86668 RepID=UPI002789A42C|nr:aromatic acid/H+ symport family MFS transporter [Neobacillus niacini]MDQ1005204.1 AAHS family benzoate transporter-like MFS transporter [Neobacillus niacini]